MGPDDNLAFDFKDFAVDEPVPKRARKEPYQALIIKNLLPCASEYIERDDINGVQRVLSYIGMILDS